MTEAIGKRVRAIRKGRTNLSQEGLARQADISLNVISRLERGAISDPHSSTIVRIAQALDVPITIILHGEDVPKALAPTSSEPAEEAEESKERSEELLGEERGVSKVQRMRHVTWMASVAKEFARRWEEESRARVTEGDFPWERTTEIQLVAIGLQTLYREESSAYKKASSRVVRGVLAEMDKNIESMIEAAERFTEEAKALQARHSEEPSAEQASVSEAANRHLRLVYSKTG